MQGVAEVGGGNVALVHVVAVALVDNYAVGYLHDASLYALKLVARAGQLNEQEEVNHRVTCRLALPYAHRLDKYLVVSGSLTQYDSLAGLARHASQRACRRTRTYEGFFTQREFFHTGLVAKNTSLGAFRTGVDGQDGQLAAKTVEHMHAKLVDRGTLSGTRHTADAYAQRLAAVGQALLDNLLSLLLVVGINTLYQRNGLA